MLMELFEGQEKFLRDYKKLVKDPKSDQEIVDAVLDSLRQQDVNEKMSYEISGDETKSGESIDFPFSQYLYAEDQEPTIETRFCYDGTTYEEPLKSKEQM
ncbi:hypothetical protein [Enterococcus sp. DIV0240a]|jgi:hypothetical protein|uniref:hypothetical protein n=2 Tax=unclassified Enterococcus TaxID=2608891 RepID=UPI0003531F9C|nr:hypothetical protein D920_01586 [Enterococcus faecalis 13-SD-W-01]